jgi:hypothetical protein
MLYGKFSEPIKVGDLTLHSVEGLYLYAKYLYDQYVRLVTRIDEEFKWRFKQKFKDELNALRKLQEKNQKEALRIQHLKNQVLKQKVRNKQIAQKYQDTLDLLNFSNPIVLGCTTINDLEHLISFAKGTHAIADYQAKMIKQLLQENKELRKNKNIENYG